MAEHYSAGYSRRESAAHDIVFLVADALAPVAGALLALVLLPPPRALIVFLGSLRVFSLHSTERSLAGGASAFASIWCGWPIFGILFIGIAVHLMGVEMKSVEVKMRGRGKPASPLSGRG